MGEAKRKRMAGGAVNAMDSVDREMVFKAIMQVTLAKADFSGADCISQAWAGAGLLKALGVPAIAVAGSAAWRVGPGHADVISHAPELGGSKYSPAGARKAGMFHCWIEVDDGPASMLIDLSTWQLKKKGAALDAADGGTTNIHFCPPYIWVSRHEATRTSLKAVRASFDAGVYSYVRKPELEALVFDPNHVEEAGLNELVVAAEFCYSALKSGQRVQVLGIDDAGNISPGDADAVIPYYKVE